MNEPDPPDPHLPIQPILITPPEAVAHEDVFVPHAPVYYDPIHTEHEAISTPPAVPHSPAIDLSPAMAAIAELGKKLDSLQTQFDREVRAEETREKIVDRLHAELQEYKGDMLLSVLRPVFVDLIQLHDDIGRMASVGEGGAELVGALFASIQQGIEDILYRQGVEPFEGETPAFDARRQRAVSTVPTDDAALVRSVAVRLRKGFAAGEKVIRPEIVSVFTLRRVAPESP